MAKKQPANPIANSAGNGLLDRRLFLTGGLASLGIALSPVVNASESTTNRARKPWMQSPGRALGDYGQPSQHEAAVVREGRTSQVGTLGSGASRTPLQDLQGTITPSGLHFERHHSGIPDIHPEQLQLSVQGLVKQPLKFSLNDLARYPLTTKTYFLECSGNSAVNLGPNPALLTCGGIHGLVSASEWTGVPVSYLLDEAGIDSKAKWVVAEGADAARMNRSIPLDKMLDDALLALYQNGERLRPEQGYPVRLLLPGYEGNTSVKWLHRLEVSAQPAMSRQETSKYTDLNLDGRAEMFTFEMGVKSAITSPSGNQQLTGKGYYEISGLAWSGYGPVRKVDVSADGGKTWAAAQLEEPILDKSLTRFRIPWHWDGTPCTLLSRAADAQNHQPTRAQYTKAKGTSGFYHYNAMQAWRIEADGGIHNVYV